MSQARAERAILTAVGHFFKISSKPFAEAESLDRYSLWGYVLLGLVLGVVLLAAWLFANPLEEPSEFWKWIYNIFIQRLPIKLLSDNPKSILLIPMAPYLGIFFWKAGRTWLGEQFANLFFWLIDRGLALGEFCLERRWMSLFLVIALVSVLGIGTTREVEKARQHQMVERDYQHWLELAEAFIERSPLTHSETDAYNDVQKYWHEEFVNVPDFSRVGRSGVCLKQMLDRIHSSNDDQGSSWKSALAGKREILEKMISSCPKERGSHSTPRALALMHLLMGRVYSNLSDDTGDPLDDVTRQSLESVKALDHFVAVEVLESLDLIDAVPRYHSSVSNGEGTVYAHFVTLYSRRISAPDGLITLPNAVLQLCDNFFDCALKAFKYYEEAGNGYKTCSYEDQRKMNNQADLLIRIAKRYSVVTKEHTASKFGPWLESPSTFAAELEKRAFKLLSCMGTGRFLSPTLVTGAQVFGIAAKLRIEANEDAVSDVRTSGFYLQLVSNFEPNNVSDWDLSYFCSAIHSQTLEMEFRSRLTPPLKGLVSEDQIIAKIRRQCQ
jgi:hypothetical protein